MTSKGQQVLLSSLDPGELRAQRLACAYLVKGCERALFEFGLIAGETASARAAEVDGRAVEIMREVLGSWRDTLALLPDAAAAQDSDQSRRGWVSFSQGAMTPERKRARESSSR